MQNIFYEFLATKICLTNTRQFTVYMYVGAYVCIRVLIYCIVGNVCGSFFLRFVGFFLMKSATISFSKIFHL